MTFCETDTFHRNQIQENNLPCIEKKMILYDGGVQQVARVPNVARDNIESGTRALAIFHKHATIQF